MFSKILTVSLFALSATLSAVKGQGDLTQLNNITALTGTWSSGSGGVQTGGVSLSLLAFSCDRVDRGW